MHSDFCRGGLVRIVAECLFWILFLLSGGIVWAILGSFLTICIVCLWGSCLIADKLFLTLAHCRQLEAQHPLSERVKNLSFCAGLPPVEVFVCQHLPENIYALGNLWGRSCLVITPGVLGDLEHIDGPGLPLVDQALHRIAAGDSARQTLYSFLFGLIEFPYHVLIRLKGVYWLGPIYAFFLIPVAKLKGLITRSGRGTYGEFCARLQGLKSSPAERPRGVFVGALLDQMASAVGIIPLPRHGPLSYLGQ